MALPRRRTQRIALVVLGALLVALGAQKLAASETHDQDVRVERHHHKRHNGEHHREHRVEREVIRNTRTGDVLFAQTFAVREGDRLDLNLGAESVEILPARGNEATVTVRGQGRDAQQEFERRRFSARFSGGVLDVRTDPPRSYRMRNRDAKFSVTIEVPARFDASLDLGSGPVHIERLSGDLNVDTGSGAITVGTARGGRIDLSTGSGSIRADVLAGDIELDTGSGAITIGRVTSSFTAETGSGSIRVAEADVDRFVADTGSGSVTARLLRDAEIEVDTGSGRVELDLPRASGADVELSGRPIRIDDALGFEGRKERNHARGRIGGGGPEMHIDTGSGGVTLRAR